MEKPTWDEFLFHYMCEWDTTEILGWDEIRICMLQYEMLKKEEENEHGGSPPMSQ